MKRNSSAAKAFEKLKLIIINSLQANTRLRENYWAKELGVSRITVRIVFSRLIGEGLVIRREKGGYLVKAPDPSELQDIWELWAVLELGAMRLAFRKMNNTQFKTLETICDDFNVMFNKEYIDGAYDAATKFHEALLVYSQNKHLQHVYQSSQIAWFLRRIRKMSGYCKDGTMNAKYKKIIKALHKKDISIAEQTIDACLSENINWQV